MTEITQEQIDFIVNDMREKGLNVTGIPTTVEEGMTAESWVSSAMQAVTPSRQQQSWQYTLPSKEALYIGSVAPLVCSNFSEMGDAERLNFVRNNLSQRSMATRMFVEKAGNASTYAEFSRNLTNATRDKGVISDIKRTPVISSAQNPYNANQDILNSQMFCSAFLTNTENFVANYPSLPEPEPEPAARPVPRPRGMQTTTKDHRERIDQWMAHLGKADQAQTLVDKYGLDVAYAICQQSMLQPANMKDITGGTMLGSRDAVQYFLDNDVSADNLAKIPGLNAEIVEASLQSVRPEPEIEKVEPVELTPLPGVELKTPQPTAEQVSLDQQRVLFATLLKKDLQLANIPQDRVDLAIDMAFARSLEGDAANFEEWAFNFRQDLVQNLGGEKAFANKEADYNQLCATFADAKTAVVTGNVPDDVSGHTATFEGMIERNNLHLDLAGMEPSTPILTSEMYRQTVRFNKAMERQEKREARKEQREERRAEELGITVEELHQRRDEQKKKWSNFVDQINPFKDRS